MVLHPMGWDAFGLPAEQYALKNKLHPSVSVKKNIATFKEAVDEDRFYHHDWGARDRYDGSRILSVDTVDIFAALEKGLAYESFDPINWCPS